MAEKAKKRGEEQEEKNGQEGELETAPKKGLPVNIIIIGILAICLAGGGLFVWKSGLVSKFSGKDKAKTEGTENAKETEGGAGEIGAIYELETFIVNLSDDSGNHYLKVKISLEMSKAELNLEIEKRLPQFRDSILTLLSSKTVEDVKTLEGKAQIRAEVITMLNQYLKTGKISNVYFGDFIVQ
jgi:flagellar protein FliL